MSSVDERAVAEPETVTSWNSDARQVAVRRHASRRRAGATAGRVAVWALVAWIVWVSVRRGRALQRTDPEVYLGAAPLVGRSFRDGWDWRFGWSLVGAACVAGVCAVVPHLSWWHRLRTRWIALLTGVAASLFAVLLALTDGADGVLYGAEHPTEYLANVRTMPPAGEFVRTFTDRLDDYSVHVRGHPPGFVLFLQLLEWVGIGGAWATAALSILATAVVPAAVIVTLTALAGRDVARRAAPFLVVAPYAIWMVTSADAVYSALGASGIAAIALATRAHGARSVALGLAGGVVLGALMYGTYLGAVLLLVPATLVVHTIVRRERGAVPTAAGALVGGGAVIAAFLAAGFWWFDGVSRTKTEYLEGTAQFRTWGYFGVANLAVALIALGPASVAGLSKLRDRRVWLVVGPAVAALVASHLSQYTKGEVERIWLIFYPWLAIAALCLLTSRERGGNRRASMWIGGQAAFAIVLQAALVTKW